MEKQICIDYNENHLTVADIAKKYKIGTEKIRKILKDNNIHILSNSERAILKKNNYMFSYKEIENYIIEEYCEKGKGLLASGKKFNLSESNVKHILKENNITPRNFSEAVKISNQSRSYSKNNFYFSKENSNMAWILGFLASDGNVSKRNNTIKIALSSVDREILEKIKEEINIENPIYDEETNNGFLVSTLRWSSTQHKKDLSKYSIVPNKTFIINPPYKLNKTYWIDYIRGYFDGDGSVNIINNKGDISLRFQICSARKDMMDWMVNYFYEEYNIPKVSVLVDNSRKNPLYYFQYSTVSTKKIYDILYAENSLYLKRKKDKFDNIISLYK